MAERFTLIAEGLDTGPLLTKILANEDLWGRVTDRQNYPGSAHKDTETIYLRWAVDESLAGGWYCLESRDRLDEIQALAPEVLTLCATAIEKILGTVPQWDVHVGRVILTRMKPSGVIPEHIDEGPYADTYERFHVCVSGLSSFVVDGQAATMDRGQLWWFNHKKEHAVFNSPLVDRIHLIIDLIAPEYRAKRGLTFQRERIHEFIEDARPLYEAHYEEIAVYKDIPLTVNEEAYRLAEEAGQIRCFTARYNGDLVGYSLFRVGPNMRYSTSLQALQDILFVDKSKRGALIGKRLLEYGNDRLRAEGVQLELQHCKVSPEIKARLAEMTDRKDVGKLFERLGYDLIDFVYAKRLDR